MREAKKRDKARLVVRRRLILTSTFFLLGLARSHAAWAAQASLDNPKPGSFQSGIGVISGWVCSATRVDIVIDGQTATPLQAAYGTSRTDTRGDCGDDNNGFGALFNWNLLGTGVHTLSALADGTELAKVTFTVTTLGAETLPDVGGAYVLADFPEAEKTTKVVWQQSLQNFVLASSGVGYGNGGGNPRVLENPKPGSFQSGIGVISGWVCSATRVDIVIDGQTATPLQAAYGTSRTDTRGDCGDDNNGFGALFNWSLLGTGVHTLSASADGTEFANVTFTVTVPQAGTEFFTPGNARLNFTLEDFPKPGGKTSIRWQDSLQNFVIVGKEDGPVPPPVTFFTNPSDSAIVSVREPNGAQVAYFGTKDEQGNTVALTEALVDAEDLDPENQTTVLFGAQGRPVKATRASGGEMTIDWQDPSTFKVTLTLPDGTTTVTQTFTVPHESSGSASSLQARDPVAERLALAESSGACPGGGKQGVIEVTECQGPPSGVLVSGTVAIPSNGTVPPVQATSLGSFTEDPTQPGKYTYCLPSIPAPQVDPNGLCDTFDTLLGVGCSVVKDGLGPVGITTVCGGLAAVAVELGPGAAGVFEVCETTGTAFLGACELGTDQLNPCQTAAKIVDRIAAPEATVTITATHPVLGEKKALFKLTGNESIPTQKIDFVSDPKLKLSVMADPNFIFSGVPSPALVYNVSAKAICAVGREFVKSYKLVESWPTTEECDADLLVVEPPLPNVPIVKSPEEFGLPSLPFFYDDPSVCPEQVATQTWTAMISGGGPSATRSITTKMPPPKP